MDKLKKLLEQHYLIITILAASILLRFYRINSLITIGGDQSYDFTQIEQIISGNLTLLGPKIGPYNNVSTLYVGPLYYYLLAPFAFLAKLDPIGAASAYVLTRVLTTLLVYLIAIKLFSKKSAIISAVISAVSPYWLSSLGPPSQPYFMITFFLTAVFILIYWGSKRVPLFAAAVLLGFCFQLHYLAALVLIALVVSQTAANFRERFQKTVTIFSGFTVGISPMIIFELKHQFFLTYQFLKLIQSGLIKDDFINGLGEKFLKILNSILENTIPLNILPILISSIIVIAALIVVNNAAKSSPKSIVHFLILTFILNVFFVIIYPFEVQPHYLMFSLGISFVFIGNLIESSKRINKNLPLIIVFLVIIFLLPKNDLFRSNGYTMPEDLNLKEIRKISQLIASNVGKSSFNVASTLDGDSRAGPYRYMTAVYGKEAQSPENYDKPENLYVVTREPARVIRDNKTFEIASFQPSYIENVWEIKNNIRLIKLTKKETQQHLENFVTIINPIRSRPLWSLQTTEALNSQIDAVLGLNLPAAWLLQYENLFDPDVLNKIKNLPSSQEIGAFLEVSEKLATDAKVSYLMGEGDYYRPDKVFLSGYEPHDREKIVDTYFKKFQSEFGVYPKITGAWYINAGTLDYLSRKGVIANLTLSDQYNTDAASIWGQYFSFPFYPSRFNSLQPAATAANKIPIVQVQWAQRDPVLSYGSSVIDSRHSFQANDYISNGYNTSYFEKLLNTYLNNSKTDFNQITIGLEAGQEGAIFIDEYKRQLEKLANYQKDGKLKAVKLSDFANWYQDKYKGISPSHFLEDGDNFWYMSPLMRIGIFKQNQEYIIKDITFYDNHPVKKDYYKDTDTFLDRKNSAVVSQIEKNNQIDLGKISKLEVTENFDHLTLNADNKRMVIRQKGNIQSKDWSFWVFYDLHKFRSALMKVADLFRYSEINGKRVAGIAVGKENILGIYGLTVGVFNYNFQTLSKFRSPSNIIQKWQPWLN